MGCSRNGGSIEGSAGIFAKFLEKRYLILTVKKLKITNSSLYLKEEEEKRSDGMVQIDGRNRLF